MLAMNLIRTVCVYCGSGPGTDPAFMEAARRFGQLLAVEGVGLVYGGGSRGLMGAVATSVLDHGGHVTGIIPEFLQNREQTLRRAQEIIVTPDMHLRKQTMFDKADAFAREDFPKAPRGLQKSRIGSRAGAAIDANRSNRAHGVDVHRPSRSVKAR